MQKIWKSRIPAEFSATKFRAKFLLWPQAISKIPTFPVSSIKYYIPANRNTKANRNAMGILGIYKETTLGWTEFEWNSLECLNTMRWKRRGMLRNGCNAVTLFVVCQAKNAPARGARHPSTNRWGLKSKTRGNCANHLDKPKRPSETRIFAKTSERRH